MQKNSRLLFSFRIFINPLDTFFRYGIMSVLFEKWCFWKWRFVARLTFNIKKVYLDAYNKTSTAGGSRYPDVNREIRESMDKGVFFASYIGHGGEGGWADE